MTLNQTLINNETVTDIDLLSVAEEMRVDDDEDRRASLIDVDTHTSIESYIMA